MKPKHKVFANQAELPSRVKLQKWQRVFVNRSLNMANIKTIGFDMDHTLVVYMREAFEALAFRETLKKFITAGYPEELATLSFDPHSLIRGLLVDMDRGNVLKVDGHKYVKTAFHGHTALTKEARYKLYNSESFKAGSLLSVDTFFALSEVQLFTEIVDYMERRPGKIQKTYREVYQDLRRFIDQSHADGSIKHEVLAHPELFLRRDPYLATTLRTQIEAGKSLFILTNSGWDYTAALMDFVLPGEVSGESSWRSYFEYVIVSAGKPGFFVGAQPFYEVMTDSGLLKIVDGPLSPGGVYHGGNANLLQKLTDYRGDQVLFVGDHIYGDIIRSKHSVNWRTLLIVEELGTELPRLEALQDSLAEIKQKLEVLEVLEEDLQISKSRQKLASRQRELALKSGEQAKAEHLYRELLKLEAQLATEQEATDGLALEIKHLIKSREKAVHPIWGELMKVGLERSRFADQVSDYACIYTSAVSNLRFYSPFKRFSTAYGYLPHDL